MTPGPENPMEKAIIYQHTLPPYRHEFIERLLKDLQFALVCGNRSATDAFSTRYPDLAGNVVLARHTAMPVGNKRIEFTWSPVLFSSRNAVVLPNRAQDLGLWLIALWRKATRRPTYYRGHGIGTRIGSSHRLRRMINAAQSQLSLGIFTYSNFLSEEDDPARSTAFYPGSRRLVPSNNTHTDWRNLDWASYREHSIPTAAFIGSGSKKQRVVELATALCTSGRVHLKLMVPRQEYERIPSGVRENISYHPPSYRKEEIDQFFQDVDCGATFGSVGLFVNECYARGRPVFCLAEELQGTFRHAPEFSFIRQFDPTHICSTPDELVEAVAGYRLNEHTFSEIKTFYENNLSLSQMVSCFSPLSPGRSNGKPAISASGSQVRMTQRNAKPMPNTIAPGPDPRGNGSE